MSLLIAKAEIHTDRPGRYLAQLCRHADGMHHKVLRLHRGGAPNRPQLQHVDWTDTDATLTLNVGRCTLRAGGGVLTIRAEADNEQDLQQIQDIIARDLERFGRRDRLTVDWRRSETR